MSVKRIVRDLEEFKRTSPPNFSAGPLSEDDLYTWSATIVGPEGTPYSGGIFSLSVEFPVEYPFKPPTISFMTKIFHPNINSSGGVCLDILKDQWNPALSVTKVLHAIVNLLKEPNPKDPLVSEIAQLYNANPTQFNSIAREWTLQYA